MYSLPSTDTYATIVAWLSNSIVFCLFVCCAEITTLCRTHYYIKTLTIICADGCPISSVSCVIMLQTRRSCKNHCQLLYYYLSQYNSSTTTHYTHYLNCALYSTQDWSNLSCTGDNNITRRIFISDIRQTDTVESYTA